MWWSNDPGSLGDMPQSCKGAYDDTYMYMHAPKQHVETGLVELSKVSKHFIKIKLALNIIVQHFPSSLNTIH